MEQILEARDAKEVREREQTEGKRRLEEKVKPRGV
jgi:hypothetical protein